MSLPMTDFTIEHPGYDRCCEVFTSFRLSRSSATDPETGEVFYNTGWRGEHDGEPWGNLTFDTLGPEPSEDRLLKLGEFQCRSALAFARKRGWLE